MKSSLAFLHRHVLPALVCFGLAWVIMQTGLLRRVENVTLDQRTKLRLGGTVPSDSIVVIGIDEASLRDLGRWPWDREVHGDFMQLVARTRPAVVAWDILFTEPTPADEYFASTMVANRAVVLGAMRADADDGLTPAAARTANERVEPLTRIEGDRTQIAGDAAMLLPAGRLANAAQVGFVDAPPDKDGVLRRVPLVIRVGDDVYPTLSLRALMDYWGARAANVTVRLGDAVVIDAPLAHRRIPIDGTGAYTVNYRHDRSGFVEYGYSSALVALKKRFADHAAGEIPALSGRILVVGEVADGLSDFGPTPFSEHTPLTLVHANVIENVLLQDYVRPVSPALVWLGAWAVGVIGLARFSSRKPYEQAVFAMGVPVAFVVAATLAWINGSEVVPLVGPLLGFCSLQVLMIGRRMLAELRAKEQIKGMFGTYVSPELVNRLIASGKPPQLGGHEEEITAYFSDIESFSTFSELLPPDRLVELMNEYLTACTDIVQGEGGTLDKYIGDAIVAMFGAPVQLPDHAYRACRAVVRVQEALAELRSRWRAEGRWPEIALRMRTRIGLNTGPCVIGNMGGRTRFNYTMMGDNVNLAARMESGAKQWGTYAMCTETTRAACVQHGGDGIVFRPLGRIQVKGRAAAVPIFEIAGMRESVTSAAHECFALFSQALERYYARDWDGAETLWRRSAALEPLASAAGPVVKLTPSLVYLEIVRQTRSGPPPSDWDGVTVMKEK